MKKLNTTPVYKTKNLTIRYLIALSLIALLSISAYTLIRITLYRQTSDAPVINLSGRQRMLSQKLTKEVLLLAQSRTPGRKEEYRQLLSITAARWTQVHNSLQYGEKELKLPGNNSHEIQNLFAKIEPHYQTIKSATDSILSLDSSNLAQLSPYSPLVQDIVNASPLYLKWMDRTVFQYDKEAQARVDRLKHFESYILTAVLFLLSLEALFIFRPMVNKVRKTFGTFYQTNEQLRQEIVKRRQAEEELQRLNEELGQRVEERNQELKDAEEQLVRKEKLAVLGQLAGSVGHEIRNPLGVIGNSVYFLKMKLKGVDEKVLKHLDILQKEVQRSNVIITDLLDFSKVRPLSLEEADVNSIVKDTLAYIEIPENIALETRLDKNLPEILLDPKQIHQVFQNLISNALQTMPEGGRLEIKTWSNDDFVDIMFSDTGEGISGETLPKIFEPLFTTKAKGIGLGLAIVKGIVDGHKGSIEVESKVGRGTNFTVKLPMKQIDTDNH